MRLPGIGSLVSGVPLLVREGRTVWRLVQDPRVPLLPKAVVAVVVLYVLSPFDFLPDFIPLLGQLDDLALMLGAFHLFKQMIPPELWAEPYEPPYRLVK